MKRRLRGMAIVVVIVLFGVWMSANLRPIIRTVTENQAKILCTSAVSSAVMDELEHLSVTYNSLVSILRDEQGIITGIETNAVAVNQLMAQLTDAVNNRLAAIPNQTVSIPLGTLTGIDLLSGRGPRVRLRMIPSSYVESKLVNRFDTAGINQTHHQILIEFTVTMSAILAPYSSTVRVVTEVCIAETVIIGVVPETYATF